MIRAAISISPKTSRPAPSSSDTSSSSVSASGSSPNWRWRSLSNTRNASPNGGRLTSVFGFSVTWLTARPCALNCWPNSENEPPASMMKIRGRWIATICCRRYTSSADFPAPVGPRISICAFFFRSDRCNGSNMSGSAPRLKKTRPGCPVPLERP